MTVLAVMSWPGGNQTCKRHWPYFERQGADEIIGVGGERTEFPLSEKDVLRTGSNRYIDGPELPGRLMVTVAYCVGLNADHIIVAEYDTVFFRPIEVAKMTEKVAAHFAGGQTWGSKASYFVHNPWVFTKQGGMNFVTWAAKALHDGIAPGRRQGEGPAPECSPDVFVAYCCEQHGQKIQTDLWSEYSRNDLFAHPEHLDEARKAYREGVDVIHGIKSEHELNYITT